MTKIKIYGIKNCDSMKKTFAWLEAHGIDYAFHDYKKEGADEKVIAAAIKALGWETVVNRKGTTWRGLSDAAKDKMDAATAVAAIVENPSLAKRPLIKSGATFYAGFDAALFADVFGG